jgi:uncharacterized protein (TIGR02996 family)
LRLDVGRLLVTTTLANLLRAVCEDPADDLLRLVLADSLDDNGEADRAEFVRLQCKLSTLGECERDFGLGLSCCCKFCRGGGLPLQWRQDELIRSCLWKWLRDELPPAVWAEFDRWTHEGNVVTSKRDEDLSLVFRRGFVSEVRCPLSSWLAHGPAIVACQPVEAVVLADREPAQSASGWWWSSPRSVGGHPQSILPEPLFSYLSGVRPNYSVLSPSYPSREDALSALSTAAVSWARAQADLPPLPREES